MDITLRLRLELDEVRTEHLRRSPGATRDDLLERLQALGLRSEEVKIPEFVQTALLRSADILLDCDRPEEALASIARAKSIKTGRDRSARFIDLLTCEARALAQLSRWAKASSVCAEGIGIVESLRGKVTPVGLQSAYMRFKIELYQTGVRAAYELGEYAEALRRAELAKCATARRIDRSAVGKSESRRDFRNEYREICEQLDRGGLTAEARAQLETKRRALWDYIVIRRFRDDKQPADIDVTHTLLGRDEALVYYFWTGAHELVIFGLTDSVVTASLQQLSVEDREFIERIPRAILEYQPAHGKKITPTKRHSALLLPPDILDVVSSRARCLISPHRALHLIPFHALPIERDYLIDRHPVTYVPNFHAAVTCHEPIPTRGLCAIGVPRTRVAMSTGQAIPDIPNARAEVESIEAAYRKKGVPVTSRLAEAATGDAMRELDDSGELARCSHLHLVCHGSTVDSDSPLESKLILEDSVLDGLDISGFRLNTEVTVLSACCSGQRPFQMPTPGDPSRREELPGDELFGLPAAFFTAGTYQMVATLWPVDSRPAQEISTSLHENLLAGLPVDEALQQAMVDFRNQAGLLHRKVDKWAPFFLSALSRPAPATHQET